MVGEPGTPARGPLGTCKGVVGERRGGKPARPAALGCGRPLCSDRGARVQGLSVEAVCAGGHAAGVAPLGRKCNRVRVRADLLRPGVQRRSQRRVARTGASRKREQQRDGRYEQERCTVHGDVC